MQTWYVSSIFFRVAEETEKLTRGFSLSQGDHQLCATVCCVLQDKEMDFSPLFVARVTKAYLGALVFFTADPLPPADVSLPTSRRPPSSLQAAHGCRGHQQVLRYAIFASSHAGE